MSTPQLCKKGKFDEIDELMTKRNAIFAELSLPDEDLTEEQVQEIFNLRDKIQEKNDFLIRAMQVEKNTIKRELAQLSKEMKVAQSYKIPQGEIKSSIFDSLE